MLQEEGARIRVYDPQAIAKARKVLAKVIFCPDAYAACRSADCLFIATEWDEFKELDFGKVKKLLKRPLIVDGRNLYDPEILRKLGFTYVSIGRKKV
jgi:UDPglucose 6-dehydrogenase